MNRAVTDGGGTMAPAAPIGAAPPEPRPVTFPAWIRSVFGRREGLVPLIVFAGFAAADLFVRGIDGRLSGNYAHIREIPALIAEAGRGPAPSLLLLGNSLTNNGLLPPAQVAGAPLRAAKVTPDATALWDWRCIVEHQVLSDPARRLDVVAVGFAWNQLSDQTRGDASRLGAFFCGWGDVVRPSAIGLTHEQVGEFVAARASRTYAIRDALRNALLGRLIPGYQAHTQEANARAGDGAAAAAPQQARSRTYGALAALADRLEARGARLVVIAMPVTAAYEIDPGLLALAQRGEVTLLDYRHVYGIGPGDFLDSMHLAPSGREVLSARLAADLERILAARR
jgi:hypothetical protein